MKFLKLCAIVSLTLVIKNGYSQETMKAVTPADLQGTHTAAEGQKGLRSAYLTLWYDLQGIKDAEWFYDEVSVPGNESPDATYFSAIGGTGFYCGIQANSATERRVIFSVWDNKNGNNNPNLTADTNRVTLIKAGEGVVYGRFGNEGSGMHTHWVYDWKNDSTYKFLVHVVPNKKNNTTDYSMYFFVENQWKLMAVIRRPENADYIRSPYSFLEDFTARDDKHRRAGYFNNQWVRRADGQWVEIVKAKFNLPFGDQDRKVKDYGCQWSPAKDGYLMVSGGGYAGYYLPDKTNVERMPTHKIPVPTLPE